MPDTTEKKTIPRGPAATAAKNKYRDNNYDRMELAVPKGMKARIKEIAKEQGYSSQNNYVVEAVKEKYQRDTGEELTWKRSYHCGEEWQAQNQRTESAKVAYSNHIAQAV